MEEKGKLCTKPRNVVSNIEGFPDVIRNTKGDIVRIKDTPDNIEYMLKDLSIKCRLNLMTKCIDIRIPNMDFTEDNKDGRNIDYIIGLCSVNDIKIQKSSLMGALNLISDKNSFHPIEKWILSKPLHHKGILDEFLATIKTTNDDLNHKLLRLWLYALVEACTNFKIRGIKAQGVPILIGKGGIGKSTFCQHILPENLEATWLGASFDPSSRDGKLEASRFALIELSEFDRIISNKSNSHWKAYITNDVDYATKKYEATATRLARRTVFMGTSNEENFLVDLTGNRKFWPMKIVRPLFDALKFDMQQVLREAYEELKAGATYFPTHEIEHQIMENNNNHMMTDYIEEMIETEIDWDEKPCQYKTCSQIYMHCNNRRPNSREIQKITFLLKNKNVKTGTGRKRRHYHIPPFINHPFDKTINH